MKLTPSNYNLNTYPSKQQAFMAKRPDMRLADDVMRKANQEFSKLSPTRIYWNVTDKTKLTREHNIALIKKQFVLDAIREELPDCVDFPSEYVRNFLKMMKKHQFGNCGESGTIAKIGLAANGIEDVTKVSLQGYKAPGDYSKLDHSFVIVNLAKDADLDNPLTYGKKAYVVDLWDGFVDTVQNAFRRFDIDYEGNFRMKGVKKKVVKLDDFTIDKDTLEYVKSEYPNLKLKRKPK